MRECQICQINKEVEETIAKCNRTAFSKLVRKLQNLWLNTDFDLSYNECILDGSWPSAVEILTKALEKAKNHPNRKYDKNIGDSFGVKADEVWVDIGHEISPGGQKKRVWLKKEDVKSYIEDLRKQIKD